MFGEFGAVLVGALNMDEYAYGFTTENTHYGPTRNPHDPTRIAGGSSSGRRSTRASTRAAASESQKMPLSSSGLKSGRISSARRRSRRCDQPFETRFE